MVMKQYIEDGGTEYLSYLVFNAEDYGFIHTAAIATTAAISTIAISDSDYYLPSVAE